MSESQKKKILIVDDSRVVLKAIELKLQASGYEVITAEDAASGLNAARKHDPDLILMDINFPSEVNMHWDGFRIVDWMHRTESAKQTPIILITGDNVEKHKDRVAAIGAKGIFRKPMNSLELLAKIRECLGQTEWKAKISGDTEKVPAPPAKA